MNRFWSEMARRTEPYVPGEQLNRAGIIKLNTNENPYPPAPCVTEAILEAAQGLRLYPSPTADSLRRAIADTEGLGPEQVFTANGSDEVLAFSFMAFFGPGKAIRFPDVSYSFYPVYSNLFGVPFKEVPLRDDFSLDIEDFSGAGGVILPNPNAPTGIYEPLDGIRRILEGNPDCVVIIDEAYIDFAGPSAATLISEFDNLLVVRTTSKSRSLAGLRVGYALGHPGLIEGLVRIKDSFNSYTTDRLAQAGAEAAFRDMAYFEETTAKIVATRGRSAMRLAELGFTVLPSSANFLFCTHPQTDAGTLYEELKSRNILVRHFGKPRIKDFLRITVGTDEEMDKLFGALEEILNDFK
ncbi:histidinol phosphate aminotransferase apoenzyme [Bhargavaea beijingensis]|uniref:Histidinol-phosphate aminotransferase n=1 Tax=Bhargavaea beijingensis TaxID=426756 RepID=A0A1G6ZTB5_9BACL|nr:histidinol-phosphate transaminase [Bhargavaea beijingensis]SDE06024.1 histidinol phosphate aminotransferase apoenzyme [Bhargavaea beijingensis]